ncbi:uncharacterized protein L201_001950 [Kwoniella dendrophila CBS 6074]|uniref:Uncharacterized protein n=1 Tax=Kwoniella dendrophila CBS 6074 TaxID=1295534 RepID=A0AAX4JRB5_9TREE
MDYFAVYDYSGDDDEEENSSMEEDTNDAEGDMDDPDRAEKAKIDTTFRKDIWIADSVFTAGGSYVEYGGGDALGLDKDLSLIWVTLPGSYATANSYVSYGNNPQSDSIYCAVAMKVTLPRADKRAAYTPV